MRPLSVACVVALSSLSALGCGRGDQRRADAPLAPLASASDTAPSSQPSASASASADVGRVPMAEEPPLPRALPDDVDVEVRTELPKDFASDGTIAEWGDVCAPLPGAKPAEKKARLAAPTCATIVVLSNRVVIAGKLGAMGSEGMWLGLTMPLPV
ncbi:MAG: hypothetical protein HOV80_21985, partial [Polyangiaceae bacterium]|nr:hypothetical protein [Polyangiaceae bacterium]